MAKVPCPGISSGGCATSAPAATARATAESVTGYGEGATLLGGPALQNQWVFFEAAGDFGGSSAVDIQTGLVTFGGSTIWDGVGDIVHPNSWEAPGLLSSCPAAPLPVRRGFELGGGQPMAAADVDAVLTQVMQTALPGAFATNGGVWDAMVLTYPRTVGAFDPETAEFIVLMTGGAI